MYYGMIVYQDDEPSDIELFDSVEQAIEYFQESIDMRLDGALGDVSLHFAGRLPLHFIRKLIMTYLQLKIFLESLSESESQQTVTVFSNNNLEYYPLIKIDVSTDNDVLDSGHIYLIA